jgi:hypothetical protein
MTDAEIDGNKLILLIASRAQFQMVKLMQRPGLTAKFGAKRFYPSEQGLHIE